MCSPAESTSQRHFNTSRTLKAVGDSSTIDFAYLPKLFNSSLEPTGTSIRVPILPDIESDDAEAVLERFPELDAAAGGYQDTEGHKHIMKPEILTAHETLADGAHVDGIHSHVSATSDVHDGHHATEMTVDMIADLTETVTKSAKKLVNITKDKNEAAVQKVWSGFLDDLLGPSKLSRS
jgi:hypothetical protein